MAALVQTPENYLKHARKCMENAQEMTSPSGSILLNFYEAQCEYLAYKLKVTIPSAEYWWAQINTSSKSQPELASGLNSECCEVMKLLYRTAKEIENFIERCRDKNWIQAAMTLANMSDLYVFLLGSNLNFCMVLFGHRVECNTTWEWQLKQFSPVLYSDEKVYRDQKNFLERLESRILSSDLSDEKRQLARCLSERLRQDLKGSDHLECWKIDYSSLKYKEKLGSGSAGTVNKSIWLAAGQTEVAEKVFFGSDHPSFINEVKLLVKLAHPNIVPLLGYTMNKGNCSIVMELMEGDLLFLIQKRLRENSSCEFPFTIFEAVNLMLQIALGMQYIHKHHVVHRDLKSMNVLFKIRQDIDAEYIYVKVADFGLSKTKESSSTYSHQTMNTGTTRWMAPELMTTGVDAPLVTTRGHDPELRYPFLVDVYSFSMVCYEILSGKVPFSDVSSLREVKKMVLDGGRPKLPDQCPLPLKTLIHECWAAEPKSRPTFLGICERLKHLKYSLMTVLSSRLNFQARTDHLASHLLHADSDSTTRSVFTMAECEEHKSSRDCWLVFDGKVYDVTRFLDDHPGGDCVILEALAGGVDATEEFCEIEHSKDALKLMAEYHIGDIAGYIPTDMWIPTFTGRCSRSRWRRPLRRVWV